MGFFWGCKRKSHAVRAEYQEYKKLKATTSTDEVKINMAATTPPLSFPNSLKHFSKTKQDVWIS